MSELILTTCDRVPAPPRGFVRDLRVRWALEEAGLPYRVATTPFHDRGPDHFAHQPFGQAPWLHDGEISIFESGAILLYLGERSATLLPTDPGARADAVQWAIAALNSMEIPIIACLVAKFAGDDDRSPGVAKLIEWRSARLRHLEAVLARREWLAGSFSIADILTADALRAVGEFDDPALLADLPACRDYLLRATARPAFQKAHADQLAHFAQAKEPAG